MLVQAQRSDGPREGGHRTEFEHQQYPGRLLHGEYRERGTFGDHRIRIFGGEPQVLVLTQFRPLRPTIPTMKVMRRPGPNCRKSESMRISFTSATSLRSITAPCATIRSATTKTLHVAHWVAYPLHSVYRGSIDRTDDFQYDPKVDYPWQPNLAAGSYRGSYDRGHQLPSADRTATRE